MHGIWEDGTAWNRTTDFIPDGSEHLDAELNVNGIERRECVTTSAVSGSEIWSGQFCSQHGELPQVTFCEIPIEDGKDGIYERWF